MASTLSYGVIGVGHLGSLHAKLLKTIPSIHVVGVFDVDRTKALHCAESNGIRAYDSLDALLAEADAVSIATPTSTHYEVACRAIAAGKHIFIEKPVTTTTQEASALAGEARVKGIKVQVGHIERFNPALLALERYDLKPMFVESHRLAQFNPRGTDVAVVLDLMIHDIDIILSLVKSRVRDIQANGVAVVSDTVDIANARLQFENGCVANVTASRISQKKMRKMRIFQKDTYISVDFSDGSAEVFRLAAPEPGGGYSGLPVGEIGTGAGRRLVIYEQPEIRGVNALQHELTLFVEAVQNNTEPAVTIDEAAQALDVAHQIMETIKRTQPAAL